MLKNNLYIIKRISEAGSSIEALVELDEHHKIFEGHFPDNPVLPGACMIQMVKELLETFFGRNLQLTKADDIKFSAIVDPTVNKELTFSIHHNLSTTHSINANAKVLKQDDTVCCKIKASFKVV